MMTFGGCCRTFVWGTHNRGMMGRGRALALQRSATNMKINIENKIKNVDLLVLVYG